MTEEKKAEEPVQLMRYNCFNCFHSWLPRTEKRPRVCPKCKSAWWDVKKELKGGNKNE